jgi:mutator family transposase
MSPASTSCEPVGGQIFAFNSPSRFAHADAMGHVGHPDRRGDRLKGFPEAITSVVPKTVVQTCIVHLLPVG